ncbi:PREDICTED: uncharacterized protein LOC109336807 isoform X2 [Lupinus angustifolius]|uniref:uncharacterized protein LOC109336807 isoform X2 n=1 Tax=Lupinus angustifolius TaxID=3871 RepID=UPI00092E9B5D|nr:PREDICTED: uncharacterized protein LOC109336807 isoform X2 [Lupinus angustifolius]
MDNEVRHNLHDDRTSECRSFGSNILPSSQSRKISIGVMADSKGSTRCGITKDNGPIVANTERLISNVENFIGEISKVQRVTTSFNTKKVEGPEEALKCSWIPKPFYQRTTNSDDILQPDQAFNLLASAVERDKLKEKECAAGKNPVQLFSKSNQISIFTSSNDNQKKSDGETSRSKGRKDETTERVEEFTFIPAKEVSESDKTKPENKTTRFENNTENLRMKLCQILGTTSMSAPGIQHADSQTRKKGQGEDRLPLEQPVNLKDKKFVKARQYSDPIETDSENTDRTPKRPVTRSVTRKRMPSKKQQAKGKNTPSSIDAKDCPDKSIFSFNGKWTGRRDTFPNDGSSMSLKEKGQGKNSKVGPHKTFFTENDIADKFNRDTSKTDLPLNHEVTFSLGNKMGGFSSCLPDHQTKCPPKPKLNQRKVYYQPPAVNNTDMREELQVSEKGNQQEYTSDPVVQNVAKSQDNLRSPTLQLNTPVLSSSPSPTAKTDQKANDISSPVSSERFSLGAIRNLRTFQTPEPEFDWPREQKQSSDMEGLKYSTHGKETQETPPFKETEEQDGSSDSSSEESNFSGSQEGAKVRHIADRKSFTLRPVKRMRKHEGIKLSDRSPASVSSKGSEESDSIDEASEQNQDGFVRAVELFASELVKLKTKLKSMTSQKSSEILKSVAEEIHLQLQNVHSQIQTDIGKLTGLSKSKRKRLETRFEDQQKHLRLIYDKFKEEVNLHLQDCRSTVEALDADQIEIKGAMEKQRVAHKKLLSHVEEAVEMQLNDAQRKISATHEMARGKLLQLKQVIVMCLEDGIIS